MGPEARSGGRTKSWSGERPGTGTRPSSCFRCEAQWIDQEADSYLLGVYLGDGWIWKGPSDVYHLRISCDLKYPGIINEVAHRLASGTKRYRYSRYMFTSDSTDILRISTKALDMVGVHWARTSARDISVARREDVAFLDTFVGPKR